MSTEKKSSVKKAEDLLSDTLKSIKTTKSAVTTQKIPKSSFRKAMRNFKKLGLDKSEFGEEANKYVLQSMLNMLIDLIPIQEENCRQFRNERAAYALNTYIAQSRELINDIRNIEDFQEQAETLKNIFHRHCLMIIQNLMDEATKVKSSLVMHLGFEVNSQQDKTITTVLTEFLREHGKYIKEVEKSMEAQIDDLLTNKKPPSRSKVKTISHARH